MSASVSVRDLKDTASFARTVSETSGPVIVTKNGYEEFVVMRSGGYEAMQLDLSKVKLLDRIAKAECEYATGQYSDGVEFFLSLRKKYGL